MKQWDVIVVGGGPGGATTATYLARSGHSVLLLESERHPRHRVGESLLPSMMPVLEDFGLLEAVEAMGFPRKTGGTFIWGKTTEPWDVLFSVNADILPYPYAFHVERALFDELLLRNAQKCGVEVREEVAVYDVLLEAGRVVGVVCGQVGETKRSKLRARYVVDASGSAAVIGRRVTERVYDDKMRNMALYAYWKNVAGPPEHRALHVSVLTCKKGWLWYIPMNSASLGQASVGVVTGQEFKSEIKRLGKEKYYAAALAASDAMQAYLGPDAVRTTQLRAIKDWAYACERTAGPGFYLVGDAAAFLDPLLSTGVSMAMVAGYSASVCLNSALSDPSMDEHATAFFHANYRRMYEVTRDFLHYFYAGNQLGNQDYFWKARGLLQCGDNIGAQQAFAFLVNTIPANPHPAVRRQLHMFGQFMANIEHPVDRLKQDPLLQAQAAGAPTVVQALTDGVVPRVNGALADSCVIDRATHRLLLSRGINVDVHRPVFNSTSAWLLGRNFYALDEAACALLGRMDGRASWGQIVRATATEQGRDLAEVRACLEAQMRLLQDENYVLLTTARRHVAV